jgi:hypothetical protein
MQKRGRPPARIQTEQVAVRLPREMVGRFRKSRRGVSGEIQDRLWRTIIEDGSTEPNFRELVGRIELLAKDVGRAFGAEWYADQKAHRTFVDVVRRLLADLPEPADQITTIKADPTVAGELIYQRFVSTMRELEEKGSTEMKPTIRYLLEGGND